MGIRDLVTCVAPSTETNRYEVTIRNQYIWYMLQRINVPSQSAITGYQHRERQGHMYSNRKIALNFISSKSHREKKQLHQLQNQRTVVAYGDANFLRKKGHSPTPVKKTLQAIAQKALIVLINEYQTSITCSTCHNPLDNVYSSEDFKCEHRKRTIEVSFEALSQLFRWY
ncbi:hypothetical protein K501DRAFT_265055 [Backusella circina FSU 941]|nr:hypothetical protein K501DRAFT_265055 [Backusella circina FSU 941]